MTEPTLSEGLATTRSIRRYTDDAVTDEQLAKVMHLATRAPSGSNRQPFRFIVLRDGDRAKKVRSLLAEGAAEVWEAKRAKGEFPDARPDSATGRMLAAMDDYVASFAMAPVIVLPCMLRYRAPVTTEGASIYPAVQNLLLGARAVGLGGALTMFHQTREAAIEEALEIPPRCVHCGNTDPRCACGLPRAGQTQTVGRSGLRRCLARQPAVGRRSRRNTVYGRTAHLGVSYASAPSS